MGNFIVVRSSFGHEIMALNFAKTFSKKVVIIPAKDNEADFNAESEKIFANLSFFTKDLVKINFSEKEEYEKMSTDIIADLKAGKLADELWTKFANFRLVPTTTEGLPKFAGMRKNRKNLLLIPQKLISDGECGVTAQQQSVNPTVFNFLKEQKEYLLVLGQHFHKVNDLEAVQQLAESFKMYVPGMTEDEEVFGIRGVAHKEYYNMYSKLGMSIGIAGTHTWIMLTTFPWIPQVILYNRKGVENWDAIAKAYQAAGYPIRAIGFDEKTDMKKLSTAVESYYKLFTLMAL